MISHTENRQVVDVSVVLPILNEQDNVGELYDRVTRTLTATGKSYEILFVDDGSIDNTLKLLKGFKQRDDRVKIISFTRNFGQNPAVIAGFRHSRGEVVINLDSDLQNEPEDIPNFLAKIDEGYDLVRGYRKKRYDPLWRKVTSKIVNKIISNMTGTALKDFSSFIACRRSIIDNLLKFDERSRHTSALLTWIGGNVAEIEISHSPRRKGTSKYNFSKLFRLNVDLITGFSTKPIQFISVAGIVIALVGTGLGCLLLLGQILEGTLDLTKLLIALLFLFMGLQFIALGIIGEYIARIYTQVQNRPYYLIREILE